MLLLAMMLCLITCSTLQISIYIYGRLIFFPDFVLSKIITLTSQLNRVDSLEFAIMSKEIQGCMNTHVQTFVRATEKVCMHSHSPSPFLPVSHTHAHTHAIKQSASDQSRCAFPSSPPPPPPPRLCHALWAVNTIQRNGSLEATKTSSYLTPDTR